MHTLIIKAHPRGDGFSHDIAARYEEQAKSHGNTVEILELTDKENYQDYATFVSPTRTLEDESTKRMQEKIAKADELVWIFPVWWMDCPAVMKNFWDRNFTSGFAFRYNDTGKVDRLLTGKTAKVYATAGGPAWIIGFLLGLIWRQGRFAFVGIKTTDFRVFGNFSRRTQAEKDTFLQSISLGK